MLQAQSYQERRDGVDRRKKLVVLSAVRILSRDMANLRMWRYHLAVPALTGPGWAQGQNQGRRA